MSFRTLAITAAAVLAIFAVADSFIFRSLDPDHGFIYNAVARASLLALVAVSAGLTASRFSWWGEHLGRGWTLFFAAYACLTIGEILRKGFPQAATAAEACIIGANLALIGAYVIIARSLKVAGLDFGGSRAQSVLATVVALLLALAICHESILDAWNAISAGSAKGSALISPVADVITFALVAPLLLTAWALRGGQQFWVFALLTLGTLGWMFNQGSSTLLGLIGITSADAIRSGRIFGFAMACLFIAAAAAAQRLAAHQAMRSTDHV